MFQLSKEQQKILESNGHLLITGGPGSGKTTISILKADKLVSTVLKPEQKVLFLSFARATVSRVIESINKNSSITLESKRYVDVDTFHSFFWRIIKAHGYLLSLPRDLSILTPPLEAVALSDIRNKFDSNKRLLDSELEEKNEQEKSELIRIAQEEGRIAFDLFAFFVDQLVSNSYKIRELITNAFPFIIIDEFQDTNTEQWSIIKKIGSVSTLIALADPEQRIYDFIGADPERIEHFRNEFNPLEFDLSHHNFRSKGQEILKFGNHVVQGSFDSSYKGIDLIGYPANKNQAFYILKLEVIKRWKKLIKSETTDWSLAILVPTKKMMRTVSDVLRKEQSNFPSIPHKTAVEMEGAILAVEIIAFLLQPPKTKYDFQEFVHHLIKFYQGKGGDSPTKTDINTSHQIKKRYDDAVEKWNQNKDIPKRSIIRSIKDVYEDCRKLEFTGNPEKDWILVRNKLEDGKDKRLQEVAREAKNIRLLNRGTRLRESLSEDWRENSKYLNALEVVQQSFVREHFATSMKPEKGIIVMNLHKAKGKQFDEVVIFEGWPRRANGKIVSNPDRILRGNNTDSGVKHAKYVFRVGITRAKLRTTIMTPKIDPCALLIS
ncbi:MAG TPA: ATP-dependent helicase [Balneolaceae bacterium]